MSLEENAKRKAQDDVEKKLNDQKIVLLNTRDPKQGEPVTKVLPKPTQKMGPPPRKG